MWGRVAYLNYCMQRLAGNVSMSGRVYGLGYVSRYNACRERQRKKKSAWCKGIGSSVARVAAGCRSVSWGMSRDLVFSNEEDRDADEVWGDQASTSVASLDPSVANLDQTVNWFNFGREYGEWARCCIISRG